MPLDEEAAAAKATALAQLETPCIVIDTAKMEANIRRMAEGARQAGVALRPHTKTHKMPQIAHKQIAAGASGITVAKVSEAEVMASGGIDDIFIAYPLIAESKIERALRLSERIDLIIGVDSLEGARRISTLAKLHNRTMQVRLEVDTGLKRTGIPYEQAVPLAREIHGMEGLDFTGIYTFRGAVQGGAATLDRLNAGLEEGQLMVKLADMLRSEGIPVRDVSVGSSPTGLYAASVPGVTEIRPGTYVFQDRMTAAFGLCTLEDCAAFVVATVVSRPDDRYAVIDGGSKTFATDVQPRTSPLHLEGFGYLLEAPDAVLERMSEEHGMIRTDSQHTLKPGDRVRIIPNHICSTVNLHNNVYFMEGDRLVKAPVAGRGMLE
ncbi:alanine racemase [Paenibacillus mendelii]|nr:alanine racemase [Paenibacillus mendelii]